MASTIASRSNVNNNLKINVAKSSLLDYREPTTYVRPADWLTLPTVTTSDETFVGLIAVTNDSTNYVCIQLFGGATFRGTIDWGDGTSDTLVSNTQSKFHTYDYATLSSTVSSRGYKMAIVTITVTAGLWTGFNICASSVGSPGTGNNLTATYKWLDVAFAGPALNTYACSGSTVQNQATMLEQVNIVKVASVPNPATNIFQTTATALQNVIIGEVTTPSINMTGFLQGSISLQTTPANIGNMFAGTTVSIQNAFASCTSLTTITSLPANISSAQNAFSSCTTLQSFPNFNLGTLSNAYGMFSGCTSLVTTPVTLNTPSLGNLVSMFDSCTSLKIAPSINAPAATDASSVFNSCNGLKSAPGMSLGGIANVQNFFNACTSLTEVGVFKATGALFATSMFATCGNLVSIAGLEFRSDVTNLGSLFQNCRALTEVPLITSSNITTATSMFSGCASLNTIPLYNFSKVADMSGVFNGCTQLTSIPTINTINATNFSSMFNSCTNLSNVPNINTSNGTNFTTMFNACTNLESAPPIDTTKGTSTSGMFNGCAQLTTVPTYNTTNNTTTSSMFAGCGRLTIAPPIDTSRVLSVAGMFTNCKSLNSIPAYDLANVTGAAGTGFLALTGVSNISMTGMKLGHNISNDKLGKTELENYFANCIGSNTAVQTLTITNNPGADTANAKTSGTTAGSNVVTMANTVGITSGTFLYGTGMNTGIPVTFNDAANTVVYTNGGGVNGLANDDNVLFTAITTTTGIVISTRYWVVNRTSTTFQVAATQGGAAINLVTNGTGVMSIGGATISNQVVTVNANANVIISGVSGITNAAAALTARNLNTNYAVTKNWTITG